MGNFSVLFKNFTGTITVLPYKKYPFSDISLSKLCKSHSSFFWSYTVKSGIISIKSDSICQILAIYSAAASFLQSSLLGDNPDDALHMLNSSFPNNNIGTSIPF